MKPVKFITDFDANSLKFENIRTTGTGTKLINVVTDCFYQTPWMDVLYDVQYNRICVNHEEIKKEFEAIDNLIVEKVSSTIGKSVEETKNMYSPIASDDFRISIATGTAVFDTNKRYFNKDEVCGKIKYGDSVRIIMDIKKVRIKDDVIKLLLEITQMEMKNA